MLFRRLEDPQLAQYAYLIGCQRTGEAIVFDPERDVDRYIDVARREGLRIVAVAETHIHADFLSGARELAERVGAHVYVGGEGGPDWQSKWVGPYKHTLLKSGDTFAVGNIHFKAVHTPGHTPEHVMYLVSDRGGTSGDAPMGIITGDFVFVGDLGRPDLLETAAGVQGVATSSAHTLWRSARDFMQQPDYLQVWPAHGAGSACGKSLGAVPQSTVGYEKLTSPILQLVGDEQAFVDDILSGQPEPPMYFARMKVQNRDGVAVLGALPQPRAVHDLNDAKDAQALTDPKRTVVIDTRPWNAFRAGHVPGSIFAPVGKMFPTIVGSYVDPAMDIALVCEPAQAEGLVRDCVRIGLDRVVAIVPPAAVKGAAASATAPEQSVQELAAAARQGATVLDVRGAGEHASGAVQGAAHCAYPRLPTLLEKLPRDKPVLVHCAKGGRSAAAVAYLRRNGVNAVNIAGGFEAWRAAGLPVHTPQASAAVAGAHGCAAG
ncbi:MAG: MBL fold metallo-hydrolase, partial [Phycisphaerae bacterium]|nr:MBL fold metallo-hydrolase [Phycisphaerae bacterium]